MEEVPTDHNKQQNKSRSRSYLPQQSIPTISFHDDNNSSISNPFGRLNQGLNEDLFEESMQNMPDEVKAVFDVLNNPNAGKATSPYRLLGLVGPTGSGKSVLAKSIARALGKNYLFVPAPALAKHYKNHTSESIRSLFDHLQTYQELPILILDEVNKLVDDHKKDGSDSDMSATALWEGIDDCIDENPDLIIIATSNDFKNMPEQLQNRFSGHTYDVPYKPLNKDRIQFAVKAHTDYTLASRCEEDPFFTNLLERCRTFSVREVNTMIGIAGAKVLLRGGDEIDEGDIHAGHAQIVLSRERHLNMNQPQESGEDRRLRLTMEQNQRTADRTHKLATIQLKFQAKVGRLNAWKSERDQEKAALNAMQPGAGEASELLANFLYNPRSYSDYYNEYHQDMLDQIAALDQPAIPAKQSANPLPQAVANKPQPTNDSCSIL